MYQKLKAIIYLLPLIGFLSFLVYQENLSLLNAGIIILISIIAFIFMIPTKQESQDKSKSNTRANASLFLKIMENLSDPFLLLDKDQNTLMANKSATSVFGTEIVNMPISDYIEDSEVISTIKNAIKTGTAETVEYIHNEPRQKNYLLRIHVLEKTQNYKNELPFNIPGDSGNIYITMYDITSIREAERMRVDFVANVSHELRTPLASILGFIETLQGPAQGDTNTLGRFLKIMQDEAGRMTRLIEDLLSLSHIERDAHIPPSGQVSLFHVISSVIETLNIRLSDRHMTTSFNFEENIPEITGDSDQLTQVFQNLIDNAIKYGAEHSNISVNMQPVQAEETGRQYIEIKVKNLGAGISEEHLERLTERFYRIDTARSRSMGGTGLGLAIVKHIIQRHEGILQFQSEVGISTTVIVLLPLEI